MSRGAATAKAAWLEHVLSALTPKGRPAFVEDRLIVAKALEKFSANELAALERLVVDVRHSERSPGVRRDAWSAT